jgi:glycosyltransferase involved in cell wall biosynthesis
MTANTYPLVTIAIPTYNRANSYLEYTLKSAIHQTYPNIEIIVSNNCSTDHTEVFVKNFSDSRIRYFKQVENVPAGDNYNHCLAHAEGLYFILLHDDDMIDKDFVEVCMKAADGNTDVGIIRTGMRRIDEHGKVFGESLVRAGALSTEDFFIAWFRGKTPMHLCATLFNTKRLKEIGGFNSKHHLFDDVLAHVQLAARYGRVDIQDAKASFRMHASQRANLAKINSWCEDSLILLDAMCHLIPDAKKENMRREGLRFFSRHNYRLASKITSPIDRFSTYIQVFRTFDYQYSPLHFFTSQALNRMRRTIGKTRRRLGDKVERAVA